MIKLLIIADDFTGALDTGVQFSKKKIPTLVTIDSDISASEVNEEIEVLVIDSESRHLGKEDAYKKIKIIVEKFKKSGVKYFYKKVDSTLRGNVGSEMLGFMEGLSIENLPFIPAFPNGERITEIGNQYVEGLLLEDSIFSKDPFHPAVTSFIPEIISSQIEAGIKIINRNGEEIFTNNTISERNIEIYDAVKNDDLKNIGNILKDLQNIYYSSGSAGFAEILSEVIEFERGAEEKVEFSEKILFVSGSVNQVSLNQASFAKKSGYEHLTLTPEQKISRKYRAKEEYIDLLKSITESLEKSNRFLIEALDDYQKLKLTDNYAEENNVELKYLNIRIAENMGEIVKSIIDKTAIKNLVVFGGDTLMGIADKLNCKGIQPISEISPGVVYAKILNNNSKYALNIFTKAGGFGKENIIEEIEKYIKVNKL